MRGWLVHIDPVYDGVGWSLKAAVDDLVTLVQTRQRSIISVSLLGVENMVLGTRDFCHAGCISLLLQVTEENNDRSCLNLTISIWCSVTVTDAAWIWDLYTPSVSIGLDPAICFRSNRVSSDFIQPFGPIQRSVSIQLLSLQPLRSFYLTKYLPSIPEESPYKSLPSLPSVYKTTTSHIIHPLAHMCGLQH